MNDTFCNGIIGMLREFDDMKAAIQRIETKLATIENGATCGATQQEAADIARVLTEMKTRCYGTAQKYGDGK